MILERNNYVLIHGDNRQYYESIGPVQAVITDPPYGDQVHDKEKVGRNAKGQIEAVPVPFEKLDVSDMLSLADFVEANVKGWSIIFCQTEQAAEWRDELQYKETGKVRYFRPMVWIKPDAKPNLRGHGPGVGFETILSFWCGGGPQSWNGGGKVGVFYHTRNRRTDGGYKHPTEKPVPLMKELVRYFTNPGDTIFDPFMGCGSTGVAALELGRKFIGIEQNEEYFNEAKRRLEEAAQPGIIFEPAKQPTLLGDSAFGSSNTRKMLERKAREKNDAD